jgi:hypothetical protein
MESKSMNNMEVKGISVEDEKQDRHFVYKGKNSQAGEYWLDLITQITLDYRRSTDSDQHDHSNNKVDTVTLTENNDAVSF